MPEGSAEDADGTDRSAGELERYAIDHALRAAWVSEWWNPFDPDFGYTDYFEAITARNLSLLHGFEELAEDAERRGVLPQSDDDQTKLVTDGGRVQDGDGDPQWVCKHCDEPTTTPVEVAEELRPMCPSCWRDGHHLPAEP